MWPNPLETADLFIFTEEFLNGKLHFLCSDNTWNVKLTNSQINKLKSGIKNNTEVTLKVLSNVIGDSNDDNNFRHKLFLTNTQISRLREAFASNYSTNIKLSKIQLHKTEQPEGFLGRLLEPLLKPGLPLTGNVLKPLAKSVLVPLGLKAVALATDGSIHKKMLWSGTTTLINSSEEMNDIMKIVNSLEESGLLIWLFIASKETITADEKF